jgi:hypothetical protein
MSNEPDNLSADGSRRAERALADAMRHCRTRRRVRRSLKTTAALLIVAATALIAIQNLSDARRPDQVVQNREVPVQMEIAPIASTAQSSEPKRESKQSEPEPKRLLAKSISDEELLNLLAANGTPAGLARIGDRVELVFHRPR